MPVSSAVRPQPEGPGRLRQLGHRLAASLRSPDVLTDLIQIVKSVIAATTAWWISANLMHSELPFLAPWTALLAVQATVYRSVRNGLQTWVASGLGVGVSFLIGSFLGVHLWTFALAVFVGLLGARIPRLRTEGTAIATTAIFVLGSGFGHQAPLLNNRLLEVALGVGVGVLVNVLLAPPLRDRQAAWQVDGINQRMGEILIEMAEELTDSWDTDRADVWVRETVALDRRLGPVNATIQFAQESAHFNLRRRAYPPHRSQDGVRQTREVADRSRASYTEILGRLGEGISHLRHLVRTISQSTYATGHWDERFRTEWVAILHDAGHAIHDPDADVQPIQDRLTALATNISQADGFARSDLWPTYGSLITGLRHIAVIVDDVASARRAREGGRANPPS